MSTQDKAPVEMNRTSVETFADRQIALGTDLGLQMAEARRKYFAAAGPLLDELREAGYQVKQISDLRQPGIRLADVIPTLLKWLPLIDDYGARVDILATLSDKRAKAAVRPLIEEFKRLPDDDDYKWQVGSTIEYLEDDSVFDDIVALVTDVRHGQARQMLVSGMRRMKDPRAVDVLISLLGDDVVAGHALSALRKLGAVRARPFVEPFLTHRWTWWRNEAKKAIAKFDKLEEKQSASTSTN